MKTQPKSRILEQSVIGKLMQSQERYLLVCWTPVSWPLNFIRHYFLLEISKGNIDRHEVFKLWSRSQTNYLLKNYFKPTQGNRIFFNKNELQDGFRYPVYLESTITITGDLPPISTLTDTYPHKNSYRYWPGPNSNTFVQYIVGQFKTGYSLPASAVGKKYQLKG